MLYIKCLPRKFPGCTSTQVPIHRPPLGPVRGWPRGTCFSGVCAPARETASSKSFQNRSRLSSLSSQPPGTPSRESGRQDVGGSLACRPRGPPPSPGRCPGPRAAEAPPGMGGVQRRRLGGPASGDGRKGAFVWGLNRGAETPRGAQPPRLVTSEQRGPRHHLSSDPQERKLINVILVLRTVRGTRSGRRVMLGNMRAASSLSCLPGRGWGGGEKHGE